MPFYDYECAACGHVFEAQQSIHDPVLTECPVCRSSALRRLISKVGLVFKGPGFYVNDYGRGRNRSEEILDD